MVQYGLRYGGVECGTYGIVTDYGGGGGGGVDTDELSLLVLQLLSGGRRPSTLDVVHGRRPWRHCIVYMYRRYSKRIPNIKTIVRL